MHSIKMRSHVGKDGILHLEIPVVITDYDFITAIRRTKGNCSKNSIIFQSYYSD